MHFEKFNYVHKNLYYFQHWFVPLVCLIVTLLPKHKSPRPPKSASTTTVESEKSSDAKKED